MSSAFEKTLLGQRFVIDKNVDLCAIACARHRAAPSTCLNRRLHFLYDELGRLHVERQRLDDARTAFRRASSYRPFALGSRLRYLTCALDARSIAWLYTLKRRAGKGLRAAQGAVTRRRMPSQASEAAGLEHRHVVIEAAHGCNTALPELLGNHMHTAQRFTVEVRGALADPMCLIHLLQSLHINKFNCDVAAGSTRHAATEVSDDVLVHASRA